jgi:methylmalonyl-CoA mutase C-terminal domain/subunit
MLGMYKLNNMRILLSKPGLDGHDVGVKVLAHALKEAGFEVVYSGLRKTVEEILDLAVQNKVDIIGLSILSGTHLVIAENFQQNMEKRKIKFHWVIGGNIPSSDVQPLMKLGPDKVFPTGTQIEKVIEYFKALEQELGNRQ